MCWYYNICLFFEIPFFSISPMFHFLLLVEFPFQTSHVKVSFHNYFHVSFVSFLFFFLSFFHILHTLQQFFFSLHEIFFQTVLLHFHAIFHTDPSTTSFASLCIQSIYISLRIACTILG